MTVDNLAPAREPPTPRRVVPGGAENGALKA